MISPIEIIAKELRSRGKSVACAESCTGGLIAAALTERAGSSAFFRGGAVTYATETKTSVLGVPAEIIEKCGVVSAECAEAMARAAAEKFGADFALSTTGVAGPDGGNAETPVGTVFIGFSSPAGTRSFRLQSTAGTRAGIRADAVCAALSFLAEQLSRR